MIYSPERSQVLFFGGAFNPPTIAHQAIIAAGLSLPGFSELWLVPSGDRLDKTMHHPDEDRLAMLGAMKAEVFPHEPRIKISDVELRMPRPTQTWQTVGRLAVSHPSFDFWYLFGADAYAGIESWEHGDELKRTLPVVIFNRGPVVCHSLADGPGRIDLNLENMQDISSTVVRAHVAAGKPLDSFVCCSVASYIAKNKLYQKTE